MIELKKCPFCGGEAFFGTKRDSAWYKEWYVIYCSGCGAEIEDERKFLCSRYHNYDEEKIRGFIENEIAEKWNRRSTDERAD